VAVKEESDDLQLRVSDEFRRRGFLAGGKRGGREDSVEGGIGWAEKGSDGKEAEWPQSECIVVDRHY
jgi:hypothetical protein